MHTKGQPDQGSRAVLELVLFGIQLDLFWQVISRDQTLPELAGILSPNWLLSRIALVYIEFNRNIPLLVLLFILYFVIRRGESNRHYLILLVGYLVSQIIISPPAHTQYFSHMIPMLALGLAGGVRHLLSRITTDQQGRLEIIFLVASLLLLVFNLLPVVIEQFPYQPYENAYLIPDAPQIDYITENIPTSTVVLTTADNFYPLKEYRNFLQYAENLEYGLIIRQESKAQFWNRINPR